MSQEAINRAARRARHRRTLGQHDRCAECGCTELTALTTRNGVTRCYECGRARHGWRITEAHHLLGKDTDPTTVQIPGNLHRVLSDRQIDWPEEVRSNRSRDPGLLIVALLLSLSDICAVVAPLLRYAAMWLLSLWQHNWTSGGERWWDGLGLPPLWGTVTP